MNTKNSVPFYILLSALCFSVGGLFTKLLPWQALSIGSGRCILSALMMLLFKRHKKHKFILNKTVVFGGLSLCGTVTFYVMANKMTTAANAIVLQYSAPIFIILFSFLLFHKKPTKQEIYACLAVMIGIILFFVDSLGSGHMAGNFIALLSGICYDLVCMMNSFKEGDAISSMLIGHSMSAVIGFPSLIQETDFSFYSILCVLVLGVFQLGLGYIFFTKGLETTSPISVSLISTVEPILNPVWVALFYKETISSLSLIGGAVVIISITLYNIQTNKKNVIHENI